MNVKPYQLVITSLALMAPAAAFSQSNTLEEIVVTAEKREQDLQDASLSIDILSGDELRNTGRVTMEDILKDISNVSVGDTGGQGTTINIRGVGSDFPPGFSGQSVLTNYDGATTGTMQSSIFGFFDIERVEVIKGPQGTIYGGNSTGGVVNVLSARPVLGETGGYASLEIGNYAKKKLEAAANLPIGDTLAARFSGTAVTQDAYLKDSAGQRKNQTGMAARAQLLWAPTDTASATLLASYSRVDGSLHGSITKANYDAGIYDVARVDFGGAGLPESIVNDSLREIAKVQLNVEAEIGPGILTVVPSHENTKELQRTVSAAPVLDGEGAPVFDDFGNPLTELVLAYDGRTPNVDSDIVEVRYSSTEDSEIAWIGGLYYSDLHQEGKPRTGPWLNGMFMGPPPAEGTAPDYRDTLSKAAFAQVTIPIGDTMRAIVGGRFTKEEASYYNDTYPNPNGVYSEDFFDWKAGLEMDLGDEVLSYATLATAHKPGGYDDQGSEQFLAEESTSVELGLKSRWMDQRLQANGALFWFSYDNYQVVDFYFDGDIPTFLFYNAPGAETLGAELDLTYLVGDNTTIGGSLAYLHGEYTEEYITHPDPFAPGQDQNGQSIPHAPKWSYYLNADHTFNLDGGTTLTPRLSWRWVDEQYAGVQVIPGNLTPAYNVLDFTLGYDTDSWSLSFYVSNLTDEHPVVAVGEPATPNINYTLAPPRTYGFVVNAQF